MKNILLVNANPKAESFCRTIAEYYAEAATGRHKVKAFHISEMEFEPNLAQGYDEVMPIEPDLKSFQEAVRWAEHLVLVSPVWWGTTPAKFKGLLDRAFLPGFAFKYVEGKLAPEKLLKGRTAELIFTLDTPVFWYKFIYGNPVYKQLKHTVLSLCGIKVKRASYFGPVIHSTDKTRQAWLQKITQLTSRI